jgi:hypothetical protein
VFFTQYTSLNTLRSSEDGWWQEELVSVYLEFYTVPSKEDAATIFGNALRPTLERATKGYSKLRAAPVVSVSGGWPLWVQKAVRQGADVPGWYVGSGGRCFNLERWATTVLPSRRLEVWDILVRAAVNDINADYGNLDPGAIPHLVDNKPQLAKLAKIAWDYSRIAPIAQSFLEDESAPARHVRHIFNVLEPHWRLTTVKL